MNVYRLSEKNRIEISYPSTVGIEQGDHYRHVCSTNGGGHVQAQGTTG
jgi:hypothetical protein